MNEDAKQLINALREVYKHQAEIGKRIKEIGDAVNIFFEDETKKERKTLKDSESPALRAMNAFGEAYTEVTKGAYKAGNFALEVKLVKGILDALGQLNLEDPVSYFKKVAIFYLQQKDFAGNYNIPSFSKNFSRYQRDYLKWEQARKVDALEEVKEITEEERLNNIKRAREMSQGIFKDMG